MKTLTENHKTIAITCRQWGDTGKGKFVDLFADWADIIIRGVGGDNAGHTICADGETLIMHLTPSGCLHPEKMNIIGNGVAFNPHSFLNEIRTLQSKNISHKNLLVAYNARLILPYHYFFDKLKEAVARGGKIGSTGKGIGPVYTDHIDRQGLIVNDMLNEDLFWKKLKRTLGPKNLALKAYDRDIIREIAMRDFEVRRYVKDDTFDIDAIFLSYREYAHDIQHFVADTDSIIKESVGKKHILLEGAQGDLLSIDHGTYPYVTSSDCTVAGLAKGAGLRESDVDLSLGIIKGFYMTRVGCGPFPTEMGGKKSDAWCNGEGTKEKERDMLFEISLNDPDEYNKGMAIRWIGGEYGATTGRARRVGWLDLPLLRYALKFNTPDIILTKLDVLSGCEEIAVCDNYIYDAVPIRNRARLVYGGRLLQEGDIMKVAIPDAFILENCTPVYKHFPGWMESIRDCREYSELPVQLRKILEYVVAETGIRPRILSVGPDRDETIFI